MLRDSLISFIWFMAVKTKRERNPFLLLFYSIHKMLGLFFNNDLSLNVTMVTKPVIHHGFGMIVGSGTTFEGNVILRANICLGERHMETRVGPYIGDGVELGVSAIVIGSVRIPNNTRLAPNSLTM